MFEDGRAVLHEERLVFGGLQGLQGLKREPRWVDQPGHPSGRWLNRRDFGRSGLRRQIVQGARPAHIGGTIRSRKPGHCIYQDVSSLDKK
jgi:hypothetical protein